MFKQIPGYPNYRFNTETFEVMSIARNTNNQFSSKDRILKLHKDARGYYIFTLCNSEGVKTFKRHQISWLVYHGSLPDKTKYDIDHKDANKINDHITNLQRLTKRQNTAKGYQENGRKLPTGVSWNKLARKYTAQIHINGKKKHLGSFDAIVNASKAYQDMVGTL